MASSKVPMLGVQSVRRRLRGKGAPGQVALEWSDKLLFPAAQLWSLPLISLQPLQRPWAVCRSILQVLTFKP